jgi:hypothetical protein
MTDVKEAAQQAEDSTAVTWLARLGLFSRGVVWLVVGALAIQVALGDNRQEADKNGALRAIADKPLGEGLLIVLVVGFLGYGAWRLLEGAVGHRDDDGLKRWGKRGASVFRGGVYLVLAASTAKFLVSGGGGDKTEPLTARVMSHTGGQTAVFCVGVGVVIAGLVMGYRAVRQKFEKLVEGWKMPDGFRTASKVVATAGLVSRGLVFVLIGAFLIDAAVRFNPDKAKGLDATLKTLAHQPYGQVLLLVAALGLVAFALWSFVEARYRKL